MTKTSGVGPLVVQLLVDFKIHKLLVRLGNAYRRLTTADRRKVMRALKKFAVGKAKPVFLHNLWSKDDAKSCYLVLKAISPKMANDFRSWAAELLRVGRNHEGEFQRLEDTLVVRTWFEEP